MDHAKQRREARLIFKMNSLTDVNLIVRLYDASKAGVKIELIVRGICSLRPGVKGVSENIRVISIVGRFLEHSRVFYTANDGHPEIYLSSADIMGRNLDRRVELMFPIDDQVMAAAIKREVLDTALRDNVRARLLQPDGSYLRVTPTEGTQPFDSQGALLQSRIRPADPKAAQPRESPPRNVPGIS